MSMICPQCNQVYEQQEQICPTCSIHLMFFARLNSNTSASTPPTETTGQWQNTPWGRIVVGLVLAQGLALGLKQLLTAGLQASGEDVLLPATLAGLGILHSLHVVGLLIGGALAGAGQPRGVWLGATVGFGNGLLFLMLHRSANQTLSEPAYFVAQPLLHVFFGMLGGWIGKSIWTPTPKLIAPETKSAMPPPALIEMRWLHGPIAWPRVLAGATLMTCGIVWSNLILNWMIDASQGALTVTTHFQARLVSWEIAGLTMLLGAALAGATTFNGAKQGLCVGIGAAILFVGYQLASPQLQPETMISTSVCMLIVGLVGGAFGGHLFPPVGEHRRRRIVDL